MQTATTKKRPTVSIYKFPTIDSVPNTHKTHAGQVLLYHYTQDKCGTSSPLPLCTSVGQVLLYHYTQDKSGTSSPLPPRTRQVQVKFSFTTTHKTSVGQVIIIFIDRFYIYNNIKSSPLVFTTTHICRTSSPLPSHTRQVWDKLLFLLIAFIYTII